MGLLGTLILSTDYLPGYPLKYLRTQPSIYMDTCMQREQACLHEPRHQAPAAYAGDNVCRTRLIGSQGGPQGRISTARGPRSGAKMRVAPKTCLALAPEHCYHLRGGKLGSGTYVVGVGGGVEIKRRGSGNKKEFPGSTIIARSDNRFKIM